MSPSIGGMGRAEEIASARGCGLHDHLCWSFASDDELAAVATDFLADGLEAGLRVGIIVPGDPAAARARLHGLGDVEALVADGRLIVDPVAERYADGRPFVPAEQLARCEEALDEALADGFAGLRIVADVSPLVVDPECRATFARYEQLVGRLIAERPFSALCAYDRRLVAPETLRELACVHPLTPTGLVPFALAAGDGDRVVLRGELDVAGATLFARALASLPDPTAAGVPIEIDAQGLEFADHRALLLLERHARDRGMRIVVRGAPPIVARVAELLELPSVEVEVAA